MSAIWFVLSPGCLRHMSQQKRVNNTLTRQRNTDQSSYSLLLQLFLFPPSQDIFLGVGFVSQDINKHSFIRWYEV